MIVSEKIFKIMEDKGISQLELSKATGISQSTISDWKTKKTNPLVNKINVICSVLEITPNELFEGTE